MKIVLYLYMKLICLELDIKTFNGYKKLKCLCVSSTPDDLNKLVSSYPITFTEFQQFISHDNEEYRVLAPFSDVANVYEGMEINPDNLRWREFRWFGGLNFFPFEQYLYERPGWIYGEVYIKQLVEKFV